jgi:CheY-like chemotaxis protein
VGGLTSCGSVPDITRPLADVLLTCSVMPAVLFVTREPLRPKELERSVLGRQGVVGYAAHDFEEARMMALVAHPELVLIDRDLPRAEELVLRLRGDQPTRDISLAVFARGDFEAPELALLEAGANAVLRLPVDEEWDERLLRLMSVPLRRAARFAVHLRLELGWREHLAAVGLALNLSLHGMLLEAPALLAVHERLSFAFRLRDDDREKVSGEGRVVRQDAPSRFGVEFERLDHAGAARIQRFVATLPS